ncbi:MAG: hypothetical protein B6I30_07795 [Desulfobacteraceae bacterium 4572_187]|nr:MAG: hypothetical protein B6I30_07795 [Desulfobacteraceae bacterium 4572_187]
MIDWLKRNNQMNGMNVHFQNASYMESNEKADLIVKIGILCGLDNEFAVDTLKKDHQDLNPGGKIVASSSNIHMKTSDPLANFLLQNIGARRKDKLFPFKGWPLNYREKSTMIHLFEAAGFQDIRISTEADPKWLNRLSSEELYNVDVLPALTRGINHDGNPQILLKGNLYETGYNWIVVASK